MDGISVIICCYNSAKRIPETLKHLSQQQILGYFQWEIILVNNNSNDTTVEVAMQEWQSYNSKVPFKILNVPEPGKSYAIKAGVFEAKYKYSIICDDDNWLSPDYLQIAFELMESNSQIGMLGGQGIAACEINPPEWFQNKKSDYAVGKQGLESGDITSRYYLWGAGVVFRTNVLIQIYNSGIKSLLTCRKGNELTSGGDSEISAWFILVGYKLWYDSGLIFRHYIPKERLTEDYVNRLQEGFDLASINLICYNKLIKYKQLTFQGKFYLLIKSLLLIILACIYPNRYKSQCSENLSNIQLVMGGKIIFNADMAVVQNMLRVPLKKLRIRR